MKDHLYYIKKKKEIEKLIVDLKNKQKYSIPGSLRISNDSSRPKYYRRLPESDPSGRKYQYLSKKDMDTAKQLAQQDYESQLLKTANHLLTKLNGHLREFDDHALQDVYTSMHRTRRSLVTPLVISDEEYAKKWQNRSYDKMSISDTPFLTTIKGEYVRSKLNDTLVPEYRSGCCAKRFISYNVFLDPEQNIKRQ